MVPTFSWPGMKGNGSSQGESPCVDHAVGGTDAGGLHAHDRPALEHRVGHLLDTEVTRAVGHDGSHRWPRARAVASFIVS